MWRWRDGSSIRLGCSNRQRQYSRTPAGGNMADGWTCYFRRGILLSNPLKTKMGMGTWLEACRVGERQAGKAVNASRFPCASPSAKAEGSADISGLHTLDLQLAPSTDRKIQTFLGDENPPQLYRDCNSAVIRIPDPYSPLMTVHVFQFYPKMVEAVSKSGMMNQPITNGFPSRKDLGTIIQRLFQHTFGTHPYTFTNRP